MLWSVLPQFNVRKLILHLRYFVVKEKLQLLLHQFYIPETQTLVHR